MGQFIRLDQCHGIQAATTSEPRQSSIVRFVERWHNRKFAHRHMSVKWECSKVTWEDPWIDIANFEARQDNNVHSKDDVNFALHDSPKFLPRPTHTVWQDRLHVNFVHVGTSIFAFCPFIPYKTIDSKFDSRFEFTDQRTTRSPRSCHEIVGLQWRQNGASYGRDMSKLASKRCRSGIITCT
jgi:hypothetical protein